MLRAGVRFLVGELRSHKLHCVAKKKKRIIAGVRVGIGIYQILFRESLSKKVTFKLGIEE